MRRVALPCVALAVMTACSGCTRGIKEGLGATMGAKGSALPIGTPSVAADRYTEVSIERFANEVPGLMPAGFHGLVDGETRKLLVKEKALWPGTGTPDRTLIIRGKYIHYEVAGRGLSPHAEVVARVQLVDGPTGKVIVTANCVGRGSSTANTGTEKIAGGLAEGIVKFIKRTCSSRGGR